MFDDCTTLEQLNLRRRELIQNGTDIASVNAAYNKAKKFIIEAKPVFRRPPKFTAEAEVPRSYAPFTIRNGGVKKNEIKIEDDAVYI